MLGGLGQGSDRLAQLAHLATKNILTNDSFKGITLQILRCNFDAEERKQTHSVTDIVHNRRGRQEPAIH